MSEPPPLIYHYTTQAGLLGIIRRRELWASSILHLNDASEFGYAFGIAKFLAGESPRVGSADESTRGVLGLIDSLLTSYVASFSAARGRSQRIRKGTGLYARRVYLRCSQAGTGY
jgi:hypothetical protein